jgi:hypothetical protein
LRHGWIHHFWGESLSSCGRRCQEDHGSIVVVAARRLCSGSSGSIYWMIVETTRRWLQQQE